MLNRKDWLFSFVFNLLFIVILILVMYQTGILFAKEKKEWIIELASAEKMPERMRSGRMEAVKPQAALPQPDHHSLPEAKLESFIPSENVSEPVIPDNIDWTVSRINIPEMPDDPYWGFEDPYFDSDPLMEDHPEIVAQGSQSWNFSWNDGYERSIQYIPPWEYYVNKEISHQLDRMVLTFEISQDGYVSNVASQESISLNEAWFTLVENWLSRMVFAPGQAGQGSITLVFENQSL